MKERFFQKGQYNQIELRKKSSVEIRDISQKCFEKHAEEMKQEFLKLGLSPSEVDEQMAKVKRDFQVDMIKQYNENLREIMKAKQRNRKSKRISKAEMKSPR